jgi:hypothetical protein
MSITRVVCVAGALLAGFVISGYVYAQQFFTRVLAHVGSADACVGHPTTAEKKNQNEELFISCGGFL